MTAGPPLTAKRPSMAKAKLAAAAAPLPVLGGAAMLALRSAADRQACLAPR